MPTPPSSVSGRCLCGSVRFTATLPSAFFNYCHCISCRRTTGSAHASNIFFPPERFRFDAGEELIEQFTDAVDNPGFRRWFCRHCGSAVPRMNRKGSHYVVPAGLLEDDPGARPERSIFWDERAPWYVSLDTLPKFAEGMDSARRDGG